MNDGVSSRKGCEFGRLVLGCKWENELVKSWFVADIKYMMGEEPLWKMKDAL